MSRGPPNTETFTQRRFYTQRSFYTPQAFTHKSFYKQHAFTHSKRLHTEHLHTVLLHMASVYTHRNYQKLLHRDGFTYREAFTHSKPLHTKSFTHSRLSHTASVYTQNTYTQCFYTWQAFTHTNFYTGIAAPKPELDATTVKIRISSFFRRILKGKLLAPKLRKSADKSLSQPGCSHSNTIYDLQLQMTIPEHRILILINILKPVDLHLVFFNCKLLIWNP